MKFYLSFIVGVTYFMNSCNISEEIHIAKNIIYSIQDTTNKIGQSSESDFEIKMLAPPQYKVIYFYPYTNFNDVKIENSAKRELESIAFSIEKPLFAVIAYGKVLGYCDVKLSLEPSGAMPMVWSSHNGFISIKFQKKRDGSCILYCPSVVSEIFRTFGSDPPGSLPSIPRVVPEVFRTFGSD